MNPVLLASNQMTWRTPPHVLAPFREVWGQIVLDPCSSADNPTNALHVYTERENGLRLAWLWVKNRWNFCNPPYGRHLSGPVEPGKNTGWCAKARLEGAHMSSNNAHLVLLVPGRSDTQWWHRYCLRADARCEIEGRLKFLDEDGKEKYPAPFPSVLFYWGPSVDEFRSAAKSLGKVLRHEF